MEGKRPEAQLQAMWFAAGTATVIACLEHAALVSVVEQWRVMVFLALNLLLLAILFTSPSPPPSSNDSPTQELNEHLDTPQVEIRSEQRKECESRAPMLSAVEDHHDHEDGNGNHLKLPKCRTKREKGRCIEKQNLKDTLDQAQDELSHEELNERAEAFIAMFRQHLVSDAKGKSCRVLSSPIKHRSMYNGHSGRIGKGF